MIISPLYTKISMEKALQESYLKDFIVQCEKIPKFQVVTAGFSDSEKLQEAWPRLESGALCLPDETVVDYFLLNVMACQKMTEQEFNSFGYTPKETLILAKKYFQPAAYQKWLDICGDAVAITFTGASAVPVSESDVEMELAKFSASEEVAEAEEKGDQAYSVALANMISEMRREGLNAGKLLKFIWPLSEKYDQENAE